MSLTTKQAPSPQSVAVRRIWKAPASKAKWYWLAFCIVLYGGILLWYFQAIKTQQFPGPATDPLRLFGIIAFVIVFATAAYSLRRRFVRGLPGKVQNWLWMHTWAGIAAFLIVLLHENFAYITNSFLTSIGGLTESYWGPSALFALLFLVLSGIIGRLLDIWQTHVIAREASTNGVGITQALEERILELEYTVERLCAGKSEPFKQFCLQALKQTSGKLEQAPPLQPNERTDFQRAYDTLNARAQLVQSLRRQQRARLLIRTWRSIHMVLAVLALLVILYHGVMELLSSVFNIITPA